ncbi:MAG: hypothetical protein M1833_006698 [Piccolia ochrophora]|nr:MAG: hypothetical protein M1833_006698 [Piccolia ochrophora]
MVATFGVLNGLYVFTPAFKDLQFEKEGTSLTQAKANTQADEDRKRELRQAESEAMGSGAGQRLSNGPTAAPAWTWSALKFWDRGQNTQSPPKLETANGSAGSKDQAQRKSP